MLELTQEQIQELQKRVEDKLTGAFEGNQTAIQEIIAKMVVPAVILTIREYEKMTQQKQELLQIAFQPDLRFVAHLSQ